MKKFPVIGAFVRTPCNQLVILEFYLKQRKKDRKKIFYFNQQCLPIIIIILFFQFECISLNVLSYKPFQTGKGITDRCPVTVMSGISGASGKRVSASCTASAEPTGGFTAWMNWMDSLIQLMPKHLDTFHTVCIQYTYKGWQCVASQVPKSKLR